MLPESAGVENDDALSEVVGFLEACRPRMVDLVEAGMGGALGEDIFANCLQVCETKAPKREHCSTPCIRHGRRECFLEGVRGMCVLHVKPFLSTPSVRAISSSWRPRGLVSFAARNCL